MVGEGDLAGQFIEISKLKEVFSEVIYKARLPNKISKFTVTLSTARDDKKLSSDGGGEGLFDYDSSSPSWFYLKVLTKGTGTWAIKFIIPGKDPILLSSSELLKGDEISWEFIELKFTNTAQSGVTNPTFLIEKRYFS